ncbi:MAG: hypothetical protein M1831_006599 [Alyxoria varia]|nr:MAG: hypothetical protein M1831_006599 [Alyxoria varia]
MAYQPSDLLIEKINYLLSVYHDFSAAEFMKSSHSNTPEGPMTMEDTASGGNGPPPNVHGTPIQEPAPRHAGNSAASVTTPTAAEFAEFAQVLSKIKTVHDRLLGYGQEYQNENLKTANEKPIKQKLQNVELGIQQMKAEVKDFKLENDYQQKKKLQDAEREIEKLKDEVRELKRERENQQLELARIRQLTGMSRGFSPSSANSQEPDAYRFRQPVARGGNPHRGGYHERIHPGRARPQRTSWGSWPDETNTSGRPPFL